MPVITLPVQDPDGPVAECTIGYARGDENARPYRCLVDTGSEFSLVDLAVVLAHELKRVDEHELMTPQGSKPMGVYRCSLALTSQGVTLEWPELRVTESRIRRQGIGVILGRDVLCRMLVCWDGPGRRMTLGF